MKAATLPGQRRSSERPDADSPAYPNLGTSHDTLILVLVLGPVHLARGGSFRQLEAKRLSRFHRQYASWQRVASWGNSAQFLKRDFKSAASASSAIPAWKHSNVSGDSPVIGQFLPQRLKLDLFQLETQA